MMKRVILEFIIIIILSNCTIQKTPITTFTTSPISSLSTQSVEAAKTAYVMQKSESPTSLPSTTSPIKETITPRPIYTITPAETQTPPLAAQLEFKCINEISEPETGTYTGTIVLGGYNEKPTYIFDLATWTMKSIDEDQISSRTTFVTISPNNNWLAFKKYGIDVMVVRGLSKRTSIDLAWKPEWFSIGGWLSNDYLLIYLNENSYLAYNPFTGYQFKLNNDYPDVQEPIGIGADWWGPVYSPSLTRVIFPAIGDKIVLWNTQMNQPITTLDSGGGQPFGGDKPVWSPDGSEFIISYQPAELNLYAFHNELYKITADGEESRITNLGAFYKESTTQRDYSWSPDGSRIAFWSIHQLNTKVESEQRLAILDLADMKIKEYCSTIQGYITTDPPVWSPDGKLIVVKAWINDNMSEQRYRGIVLIDLQTNVYYPIIKEDYRLAGWMK